MGRWEGNRSVVIRGFRRKEGRLVVWFFFFGFGMKCNWMKKVLLERFEEELRSGIIKVSFNFCCVSMVWRREYGLYLVRGLF